MFKISIGFVCNHDSGLGVCLGGVTCMYVVYVFCVVCVWNSSILSLVGDGPRLSDLWTVKSPTPHRHSPTSLDLVQGAIVDIGVLRSVELETIKIDLCTMNTLTKDKGKAHIPVATLRSAFSHHGAIVTPCRQHPLDNVAKTWFFFRHRNKYNFLLVSSRKLSFCLLGRAGLALNT